MQHGNLLLGGGLAYLSIDRKRQWRLPTTLWNKSLLTSLFLEKLLFYDGSKGNNMRVAPVAGLIGSEIDGPHDHYTATHEYKK